MSAVTEGLHTEGAAGSTRVAVVPVRQGALPAGGAEAVAEAGGRVLLVGEGAVAAAALLAGTATEVRAWDTPGFAPSAWAPALAGEVAADAVVVLPASPDGRDLAPHLAAALGRRLLAGAIEVRDDLVTCAVHGGAAMARHHVLEPVVVTLQPGVTGAGAHTSGPAPKVSRPRLRPAAAARDAEVVEVHAPDVATMDLAEAPRLLDGPERFAALAEVATALGASTGATRVVTDRGWVPHSRQIGTTGVVVDPHLYLAFGISGAVQHTAGLGDPDHIVSVNTDPHCPMMAMADLAVVADANETVTELQRLLVEDLSGPGGAT